MDKKLIRTIIDSPENVANAIRLALQKKSTIRELIEVENDKSFIGWEGVDSNDTALLNTLESIKVGDVINLVAKMHTENEPLCFTTANDAENSVCFINEANSIKLYYSRNETDWYAWDDCATTALAFSATTPLYVKGTNNSMGSGKFSFTNKEKVYCTGNVMSLLGPDVTTMQSNNTFAGLFQDCTSLVTAPALPATTLTPSCYQNMFYGCNSLVTVPSELPATTLTDYCYQNMFYGCNSLKTAPALPATTLTPNCYQNMFFNCTSLVTAPKLKAEILAADCYSRMFQFCTSLVNAPELPATTLAARCYQYMFYNCSSLVTAPILRATELATNCYKYMFTNCNSLTQIVTYQTVAPDNTYNISWVQGITTTGTMYAPNGNDWGTVAAGNNTYPSGWELKFEEPPAA